MAPAGVFERIRSYYTRALAAETPPAMSSTAAGLLSALFVALYVLPFYLSRTTRPSRTLSRDAPSVIRARIKSITFSCQLSALLTVLVLVRRDHESFQEVVRMLGLWPVNPLGTARILILCSILFVGPLFESIVVERQLGAWLSGSELRTTFSSWTGWRNYVAGPVSEELVFRSLIIPLHVIAHVSPTRIVFLTPLYFGIAHIHHFYEFVLTHPELPYLPGVVRSLVQFAYTSLFGFFASFVYLRTGSVYAAVAAHVFCNWQGLPRVWGRVGVEAGEPTGQPCANEGDNSKAKAKRGPRPDLSTVYTATYYTLLFVGAYAFKANLWSLTEDTGALVHFGSSQSGWN